MSFFKIMVLGFFFLKKGNAKWSLGYRGEEPNENDFFLRAKYFGLDHKAQD